MKTGAPLPEENEHAATLARIRRFLLTLFVLGILATTAELLLMGHTEELQLVPLLLIAICVLVLGWRAIHRHARSVRVFQGTMILFLLSGVAGMVLHYRGNVEFLLELYPSLGGMELFWKALKGATPIFGPGIMIALALLGLAYAYRHPVLRSSSHHESTNRGE